MNAPVVLITAPSRASDVPPPWPSRKRVRASLSGVDATKPARIWWLSSADSTRRRNT
jgi:hypothetical protein